MERYVRFLLILGSLALAPAAAADTCGVLAFTGHGDRINDTVLDTLTAMAAAVVSSADGCDETPAYPRDTIDDGCLLRERCLRRFARQRDHAHLVVGSMVEGRDPGTVVIKMRLFGAEEGAFLSQVERVLPATREALIGELPLIRAELIPDAPRITAEEVLAERAAQAEDRHPGGPSCGVLPFARRRGRVDDDELDRLTALVAGEVDILPECAFTLQHEPEDVDSRCAGSSTCLRSFADEHGHDLLVLGRVSAGSSGRGPGLDLQLFDAATGEVERIVEGDLPAEATDLLIELPPLVAELLTGERPPTALEILAQHQDEMDVDLHLEELELDTELPEDTIVIFSETEELPIEELDE